ncbi:MAG TPA: MFS transporter [Nitrososphaeraceae archaeon]|nr:MFS transporter [Nitrososphaeraceae archaeon]
MPESAKLDGGDNPKGKQVTVGTSKVATRSLWIMGISIILVLYVHTSLAPAQVQMAEYFDKDLGTISWVLTVYLVSGAAVTIVIGRLADTYGPKKMLLLVFVCYTVGTIFAGFATEFYTLLIFRIIQGIAVALVPVAVRIARDLFPPEKFPFAQGVLLSMYQGGSAIGLVVGAAVVYFGGWQMVFYSAIPVSLMLLFLLWKVIPKIQAAPRESKDKSTSESAPKRHGKVIDIPGVITMVLTTSTFMLCFTFLGKGSEGVGLFWTFLGIGVASMLAFFLIEKRSAMPLINLKLAFHRIIRVGNISYLMLGVVQYIIFSTIPTLGQTPEPYGLGMTTLQVGLLQLPQALVFVALGPVAGMLAVKYGSSRFIVPGSIIMCIGIVVLLAFHSTSGQVASVLILFAVGGAFVTLSANVIIWFTPPESTGVVSSTYTTMRIIGGAIGPVIAGMFMALFTSPVQSPEGVTASVPNAMAFNATFLVGAIISLSLVAFMFIMKRRALKMGMPANK